MNMSTPPHSGVVFLLRYTFDSGLHSSTLVTTQVGPSEADSLVGGGGGRARVIAESTKARGYAAIVHIDCKQIECTPSGYSCPISRYSRVFGHS